ncbi:MAG: methyltransferase [Ilumatobacteraceae bacterium]|nr:methyltransferase [Ilumatobacteraceae bacterium]
MAPFDELEALVPPSGDILDYGCGSGLFSIQLALASAPRTVHGVDLSPYKVAQGRAAADRAAARVDLDVVEPGWQPPPSSYDAVVMCDVLYLMAPAEIERSVAAAARSLRPGGTLVIKEIVARPRWKHRVAGLQELLSVHIFRWTQGVSFNLLPLDAARSALPAAAFARREVPLDRGYPYSHAALVAVREAP